MRRLLLVCLSLLLAGRAWTHDLSHSLVLLDFRPDGVGAELVLPLSELEKASGLPVSAAPEEAVSRFSPALKQYVLDHVQAVAPDGRAWSVAVAGMRVAAQQLQPDLLVDLRMQPPAGAPLRRFVLHDSAICQEVRSHAALVSVRNDWNSGTFAGQSKLLGSTQFGATALPVDRTHGSFWQGFGAVLALGMRHIAGGFDHLLFLFVLLLPAPLLVGQGRWGPYRGLRGSVAQLLKIVTAFTVGHSLTLLIGGLGWVRLPGRPVEILIALSILVSAVHAFRPWFAGKEPWVAGGFGLVHGLAFSGGIAGIGFTPWYLAMTILGFNLGVELMQIVVVLLLVPPLILLSRGESYAPWRMLGAGAAGAVALGWIVARVVA